MALTSDLALCTPIMRSPLAAEMQGAASETHYSLHQGPSEWPCTSLVPLAPRRCPTGIMLKTLNMCVSKVERVPWETPATSIPAARSQNDILLFVSQALTSL